MTSVSRRRRQAELCAAGFLTIALSLAACTKKPAAPPPDPTVTVATATRGDVPVTLSALGRVTGFYTAPARAQTSGQIVSIAFVEGQMVRAGAPIAQIDPRPLRTALAQSRAALARDEASLAGARDLLARTAPLVERGLASAQQVTALRVQVDQAAATVAGDRAAVARDRLNLDYTTIRAPISGVTGVRTIDPGNLVSPGDATGVVTIAQVQPITTLFAVPQARLPEIQSAASAAGRSGLQVDAVDTGSGKILDSGRLVVVNNRIDDGTGTVQLKATFPNAARRLWPGQQVTVQLVLSRRDGAVTVPASAVQRSPAATFVWLVGPSSTATMRTVTTGAAIGDRIVIDRGLEGGERVITDGQFSLASGRRVAIAPSAPASASALATTPIRSDDPDRLGLAL